MTADSASASPPSPGRKNVSSTNSAVSPAQAIADAWKQLTPGDQEAWRKTSAELALQFNARKRNSDLKSKM